MIFTTLLSGLMSLLESIFKILPDIPPMPDSIDNALIAVTGYISYGFEFLNFIMGREFLTTIIVAFLVLINFEQLYHLCMWVLRKIPMLGVK